MTRHEWFDAVARHVDQCQECTDEVFCPAGLEILNSGPLGEIPAMDLMLPGDLDEPDDD
jgi:hypothetical protein